MDPKNNFKELQQLCYTNRKEALLLLKFMGLKSLCNQIKQQLIIPTELGKYEGDWGLDAYNLVDVLTEYILEN